jgi:hypothetical protein
MSWRKLQSRVVCVLRVRGRYAAEGMSEGSSYLVVTRLDEPNLSWAISWTTNSWCSWLVVCRCYIRCCGLLHVCTVFCWVCMGKVLQRFMCVLYREIALILHTCFCNVGWVRQKCWMHFFCWRWDMIHVFSSKQMMIGYIQKKIHIGMLEILQKYFFATFRFTKNVAKSCRTFENVCHVQDFYLPVTWFFQWNHGTTM